MRRRAWCIAAVAAAMWFLRMPAVRAQSITFDELYAYTDKLFDSLRRCDADWFEKQFMRDASIRLMEGGQMRSYSPQFYVAMFRHGCRPDRYVDWDRTGFEVKLSGDRARLLWKAWWGGGEGPSKLMINDRTDVVRHGSGLRIIGIEETVTELVPGAEKEYWTSANENDWLTMPARMFTAMMEYLEKNRRPWTRKLKQ